MTTIKLQLARIIIRMSLAIIGLVFFFATMWLPEDSPRLLPYWKIVGVCYLIVYILGPMERRPT